MSLAVESTADGQEIMVLRNREGWMAKVYFYGAHVTSWQSPEGHEQLYLSPQAKLDGSKAIRGGIPICFPQFSDMGPCKTSHGFARTSFFKHVDDGVQAPEGAARAALELAPSTVEAAGQGFQGHFRLRVIVLLDKGTLSVRLNVHNLGTQAMTFGACLHTYLTSGPIGAAAVSGLEGGEYMDNLNARAVAKQSGEIKFDREVDRIFLGAAKAVVLRRGGLPDVSVAHDLPDLVVWNPWVQKTKSMGDLPDDAYNHFVCVEPAIAGSGSVTIPGRGDWEGGQLISLLP
ncbi:unnamed protein product [Pedinophyceae sp. YPF-701]|nr:unnamed protein product [Pedinophyceae sp. YPF-701]